MRPTGESLSIAGAAALPLPDQFGSDIARVEAGLRMGHLRRGSPTLRSSLISVRNLETLASIAVTDLQDEMEALTKQFAADLVSVVKIATLEAVAEAMSSVAAASSAPVPEVVPAVDKTDPSEAPPAPLPPEVVNGADLDRVLFLLKAKPDQHFREIRDALGINPVDLRNALDVLLVLGKILKNGRGGGMTYRAG